MSTSIQYKGDSLLNSQVMEGKDEKYIDFMLDLESIQKNFPYPNTGGLLIASVKALDTKEGSVEVMAIKKGNYWLEALGQTILHLSRTYPAVIMYTTTALLKMLEEFKPQQEGDKELLINEIKKELDKLKNYENT